MDLHFPSAWEGKCFLVAPHANFFDAAYDVLFLPLAVLVVLSALPHVIVDALFVLADLVAIAVLAVVAVAVVLLLVVMLHVVVHAILGWCCLHAHCCCRRRRDSLILYVMFVFLFFLLLLLLFFFLVFAIRSFLWFFLDVLPVRCLLFL